MGKTKKGGSGFSAAKPVPTQKKKSPKAATDAGDKEKQAVALISQRRLQEAEAIYREIHATGRKSNNPSALYKLGKLLNAAGNHEQAISSYKLALKADRKTPIYRTASKLHQG